MKKSKYIDIKRRKINIAVAIGIIICSIGLIFIADDLMGILLPGIVIGVHISLIIDEISKIKKENKNIKMDTFENITKQ